MTDYIVYYGCYLDAQYLWVRSELPREVIERLVYEHAYEATSGWVGMHGFCDEEDMEDMNEDEESEYIHQEIEQAAEYAVFPFTQDMYENHCSHQEEPEVW